MEGALISSSGDFMQNIAQSWLVWELTRSPVALGVIAFFDTLPRLLVGAVGGAIADRFDRRRVLQVTQALAMMQAIIYWLAVEFEFIEFWHIAGLAFFLGVVNTINQTARQSLVNSLVPKEELLNAIGLQSSVFNFSKILGPSVGGVIISFIGVAGCFLINALSFVALLFNLYLLDLPPWEKRKDKQSLLEDIGEGFRYVRDNRRILYIVGISYVVALFGAPYNRFVPVFATNILQVGPTRIRSPDGCAWTWRHHSIVESCYGEEAARWRSRDLLLCSGVCVFPDSVRLFSVICLVTDFSSDGRF